MNPTDTFLKARDFLVSHRTDYEQAYRDFRWPELDRFNWSLDYFDLWAEGNRETALRVVDESGSEARLTFADLVDRSNRLANLLRARGAQRGDRLLLMLPNVVPIWESILAAMKLGVVVIPATPQLAKDDLEDRFERGKVRHVITDPAGAEKLAQIPGRYTRLVAGGASPGWDPLESTCRHASLSIL